MPLVPTVERSPAARAAAALLAIHSHDVPVMHSSNTPEPFAPVKLPPPATKPRPDLYSRIQTSVRPKATHRPLGEDELEDLKQLHAQGYHPLAMSAILADKYPDRPVAPVHRIKRAIEYKTRKAIDERHAYALHLAALGFPAFNIKVLLADKFGTRLPLKLKRVEEPVGGPEV